MGKWDELQKAAKRAKPDAEWFRVKDLDWHSNIDSRAARFMVQANPKTVLSLIEQNRELLLALHLIHNEVTGNIEPTVRDLVSRWRWSGTNPGEIYEHSNNIKEIIEAAIRKATGEE